MYNMELPEDVIFLIKEYSMPVTRPDWRTLHLMTYDIFKQNCYMEYYKKWMYPYTMHKKVFSKQFIFYFMNHF